MGVLIGQPLAGFLEVLAQDLHGKVDGTAMCIAHKALEGVLAHLEGEAGVLVGMEGAEGFVLLYCHAEALGNSLNGEFS